ncbi:MAG: hypothetical protein Tsb0020_42860 [Haliangiales bacterium]
MNDDSLLHRQVHPSWVQGDRVTSQTFKPTPKDKHRLSVYNGEMIGASAAWEHFTSEGHTSVGVLSVTPGECREHDLKVDVDGTPFPEHVSIHFEGVSGNQIEKRAKKLRTQALARGWSFRAQPA